MMRAMSFAPSEILRFARLEERRLALGVAAIVDEFEPLAGGTLCFAGKGSWANQAMGVGMEGPATEAELDRLVEYYECRGVEPQVQVCPLAHETFIRGLAARGFVVREFDNVLVRRLTDLPPVRLPPGATIERIDPADAAAIEAFIAARAAWLNKAVDPWFERIERRLVACPSCRVLLLRVEGEPAAVAACEFLGPAACLFGATTMERFRGRGLQQAFIAERLRLAAEAGCEFATIGSMPLGPTERNARRAGFAVMYTKVTMVRPGEGLTPSA